MLITLNLDLESPTDGVYEGLHIASRKRNGAGQDKGVRVRLTTPESRGLPRLRDNITKLITEARTRGMRSNSNDLTVVVRGKQVPAWVRMQTLVVLGTMLGRKALTHVVAEGNDLTPQSQDHEQSFQPWDQHADPSLSPIT